MSVESVLELLIHDQRLTANQVLLLQTKQHQERDFFETLIKIYEDKVSGYLSSCHRRVKKQLEQTQDNLDTLAYQEIIAVTYSAFLELDKVSLLPSLMIFLTQTSPDLLISLGLAGELAKSVFVKYVARYRLFNEINQEDLKNLCEHLDSESTKIFPSYLFNAFVLEKQCVEQAKQAIIEHSCDQVLAQQTQSEVQTIYQCLALLVCYLCESIDCTHLKSTTHQNYFKHLENQERLSNFITAICQGYVTELSQEHNQTIVRVQKEAILSNQTSQTCLPALSLLGLKININVDDIKARVQLFDKEVARLKELKTTIDNQVDAAKIAAHLSNPLILIL